MLFVNENQIGLNNKSGMSLLEVTISIGILGVMTLAFTQMITSQQQQLQRLEFKSTLQETQTQVISALSKDTVCTNQFSDTALGALKTTGWANGKVNLTGATTDMGSPLTTKLQLNKVMLGEVAGSSIALEVGENLSGVKNNPVKEIYISDFVKKSASDDTQYTANLYATFETNPKFGAIKPIKVKMNVKTDAAGITSRAIASCSAGDGAAVAEVPAGTVGGWCEEERTYTGMQLDKSASTQWPAIYIYNRYDWISNPVCRCDTGWNRKAITSGGGAALRGGHSNVWVNYTCIKD